MSVYVDSDEEKAVSNAALKQVVVGDTLQLAALEPKQHFTQPQPHYTEASLVRALEELGIGRPSTYAPTITTILARRYIVKENKNIYVTELGEVVNQIMKEAFPTIVDVDFTATMETLLDGIGSGDVAWKTVISNFYPDLDAAVVKAEKELEKIDIRDEVSEEKCELCGKPMLIKYGPHGRFLACSGFPDCRSTMPYFEKIGVDCPQCGKDIVLKKSKKGRKYYGCIGNPECEFMVWQKPSKDKCPQCGSLLLEKGNRLQCMNEKCGFVKELEQN
jgi:DNA topoisomerase-1